MSRILLSRYVLIVVCMFVLFVGLAQAQSTQFTYQGRLTEVGSPANATYDLQFKLFDAASGGAQQGSSVTLPTVVVSAGLFTVTLDFGASPFSGAARWLEISVRPAGSTEAYTVLNPRQPLTATPYAMRSLTAATADGLSATCVNCVTSGQIAGLPGGSGNYIQNTTAQQASSNFNISGNGTAGGTLSGNIVSATTQFNIGANRVFSISVGNTNVFAGSNAGAANTTGGQNSFFGHNAGLANTTGTVNSFFGESAGAANTTGGSNSFFGTYAGTSNTTAFNNSFFGISAGRLNTTGDRNSFFGSGAGTNNTTGLGNAFFGHSTGMANTTGYQNAFFGQQAGNNNTMGSGNAFFGQGTGLANTTGNYNTILGYSANAGSEALDHATAIGAGAVVTASNQIQLGRNGLDTVSIGALGATGGNPLCLNGSVLTACPPGTGGGGTITGVTAGTGLTGGGTTGTVTLGLASGGVTTNELAANAVVTAKLADNSVTNAKIIDVAGSKITGVITGATLPGASVSGAVASAATAANFTSALAGDVSGTQGATIVTKLQNLPLPSPVQADNGKVLRYKNDGVNPASFELATVASSGGTITGVTAGTGLSGGGSTGNVSLSLAAGGVSSTELAANAVTTNKLADASVTDVKIATVAGSKVTGVIPVASVPAGSSNYIQNTLTQQASANFNISGDGTAGGVLSGNIVSAVAQYNLNSTRILSAPLLNLFAGKLAGAAITTGNWNSFVGEQAGAFNSSGNYGSFLGFAAGFSNTTGSDNSFLGRQTGASNTTGSSNTFLGAVAGNVNITGSGNTFVGRSADFYLSNTTGDFNTLLGYRTNVNSNLTNSTAIGANASVTQGNSLVLGSINGVNGATASVSVGIGTTAPNAKLEIIGDVRSSALRQELTIYTPNVINGFLGTGSTGATPGNRVTSGVVGASIGGGGYNGTLIFPYGGSFAGDYSNRVTDWFGTVGGGFNNRAGDDAGALDSAPFATVGGGWANIANSSYSTVAGGYGNTASGNASTVSGGNINTASGSISTVDGGNGNTASGYYSTVGGGNGNNAGGTSSTVGGGSNNTANGESSTVGGGFNNTASGTQSVIPGGFGARATHYGEMAFAGYYLSTAGDTQTSTYTLRRITSDATLTEMFLDPSNAQRVTLAAGRALTFDILITGKTNTGVVAGYKYTGVIKNNGGTTSLVGSLVNLLTAEDASAAAWSVTVDADDTNDALRIRVTGAAATIIRWVAVVHTAELQY